MSGLKKPLRGTRFNSRKEVMEKSKTALMAIPTIEFQKWFESWISVGISAFAVDEEGTISLLMNKTCILNFLNEFRELFDQSSFTCAKKFVFLQN